MPKLRLLHSGMSLNWRLHDCDLVSEIAPLLQRVVTAYGPSLSMNAADVIDSQGVIFQNKKYMPESDIWAENILEGSGRLGNSQPIVKPTPPRVPYYAMFLSLLKTPVSCGALRSLLGSLAYRWMNAHLAKIGVTTSDVTAAQKLWQTSGPLPGMALRQELKEATDMSFPASTKVSIRYTAFWKVERLWLKAIYALYSKQDDTTRAMVFYTEQALKATFDKWWRAHTSLMGPFPVIDAFSKYRYWPQSLTPGALKSEYWDPDISINTNLEEWITWSNRYIPSMSSWMCMMYLRQRLLNPGILDSNGMFTLNMVFRMCKIPVYVGVESVLWTLRKEENDRANMQIPGYKPFEMPWAGTDESGPRVAQAIASAIPIYGQYVNLMFNTLKAFAK